MKKVVCLSMAGVWVLGIWAGSMVLAAAPEEKTVSKGEKLIFESDGKKAKAGQAERIRGQKEKRRKERTPMTEEEKKKRRSEAISKRYQTMIDKQEATAAQWMKIRALAQQEKAALTIKEIDKLLTTKRQEIDKIKQKMHDALNPELARQRKRAEKKKLMEEKRAKNETGRERKKRDKGSKRKKKEN